jgi:hypothetical protein
MITRERVAKKEHVWRGLLTFQGETGIELLLALHVHLKVPCMHSLYALLLCQTPEGVLYLMTRSLTLPYHCVIVEGHLVAHLLT